MDMAILLDTEDDENMKSRLTKRFSNTNQLKEFITHYKINKVPLKQFFASHGIIQLVNIDQGADLVMMSCINLVSSMIPNDDDFKIIKVKPMGDWRTRTRTRNPDNAPEKHGNIL
jgi:hypothetical protein